MLDQEIAIDEGDGQAPAWHVEAMDAEALQPLFSYMASGLSQIDGMAKDSPAARDARMLAWANHMRNYQGRG